MPTFYNSLQNLFASYFFDSQLCSCSTGRQLTSSGAAETDGKFKEKPRKSRPNTAGGIGLQRRNWRRLACRQFVCGSSNSNTNPTGRQAVGNRSCKCNCDWNCNCIRIWNCRQRFWPERATLAAFVNVISCTLSKLQRRN